MTSGVLRQRFANELSDLPPDITPGSKPTTTDSTSHLSKKFLSNPPKSRASQLVHTTLLVLYFIICTVFIHVLQWLGGPLYWVNKRWFYAWQAKAKGLYAMVLITLNQWCSPSMVKISGDLDIKSQIRRTTSGNVVLDFPDRIVLVANHQIYTDWVFLWWSAYTTRRHGNLFIILKDSLQKIPIFGHGMMFFSWIFLSRRWDTDRSKLHHRMGHFSGIGKSDPMWLLIFPEGTNLSENTRNISNKWAEKMGIPSLRHLILPRSRGLQFCLEELGDSVEWIYDCTIAYSDIPPGGYGQDIYTLKTLYLEGLKAPHVHMHWRRFATKNIPIRDPIAFDRWLIDRWTEKDMLLEDFAQHGCFPSNDGYLESNVGVNSIVEIARIFIGVFIGISASWIFIYLCSRAGKYVFLS